MSGEHVGAVRCSKCGHEDTVDSAICRPAPPTVGEVCRRDPCPSCGAMAMEPQHPLARKSWDAAPTIGTEEQG